jgi:hypothetical protein
MKLALIQFEQQVLTLIDRESLGSGLRISFINVHDSLVPGHSLNIHHVTSQAIGRLLFFLLWRANSDPKKQHVSSVIGAVALRQAFSK